MSILSPKQLLDQLLQAVDQSGWHALMLNNRKPFRLRIFKNDQKGFDVSVYIWNCTHGGGSARAKDEYRVQLTGVVPNAVPGEVTLLLGWHEGNEVFVGFDINKHNGQDSSSPSIQIKEETLLSAHANAFAIHHRQNGEIAVAFRPEFFVDYAINSQALHLTGKAYEDLSVLNDLESLTESQITAIKNQERQIVISRIARRYRAADFRKRVLGAYDHKCAMCGIQLELIDAAHIIPVASDTSSDETKNGIALCKLHHSAFDRNLISFDEKYRIETSDFEISKLSTLNLIGGLKQFKENLRTTIILPNDRRDYPPPEYITEARKVRSWTI